MHKSLDAKIIKSNVTYLSGYLKALEDKDYIKLEEWTH